MVFCHGHPNLRNKVELAEIYLCHFLRGKVPRMAQKEFLLNHRSGRPHSNDGATYDCA